MRFREIMHELIKVSTLCSILIPKTKKVMGTVSRNSFLKLAEA
jgi:hypothetical protein